MKCETSSARMMCASTLLRKLVRRAARCNSRRCVVRTWTRQSRQSPVPLGRTAEQCRRSAACSALARAPSPECQPQPHSQNCPASSQWTKEAATLRSSWPFGHRPVTCVIPQVNLFALEEHHAILQLVARTQGRQAGRVCSCTTVISGRARAVAHIRTMQFYTIDIPLYCKYI